ncbi:carph-isopro domain-containing protein [Tardibacter chloracetimidivorans]|uniref:carph-isopro domain-containing protein n=1 Tax=Tardibacter chloracetimidivorans TaxID=1921510 RepID=UPI003AAEA73C
MVADIILALGGISEVSRRIDVPTSTIHSWTAKNRIPRWRLPQLEEAARALGAESLDELVRRHRASVTPAATGPSSGNGRETTAEARA